jgi:hypothetical protein
MLVERGQSLARPRASTFYGLDFVLHFVVSLALVARSPIDKV